MVKKAKAKAKPSKKPAAKKAAPKKAGTKKEGRLSKDLAGLLDLKKLIEKMKAKIKPFSKKYDALVEKVIQQYSEDQIASVKTKAGTVTRVSTVVPTLKDFDAFFGFVRDNDAPELLQRRVSSEAWRERVEAGEEVPGVEAFTRVSLQVRVKGLKDKADEA